MEWIERAIQIDSTTYHSNEELVRFLVPLLEQTGLKVEEQRVVEGGTVFKNVIATSHPSKSSDLLVLNTHLDTVAPGDAAAWTKTSGDPFRATRSGDRLYGLGSADVKLDFLCKVLAARAAKPWGRPFAIVGTFGEERGLVGVQHLLRAKRVQPKFALVGEPSNLELVYAHKGHIVTEFAISLGSKPLTGMGTSRRKRWLGQAAHSSTPQLGRNALQKALAEIDNRGWGIVSLNAGVSPNAVPDFAEAEFVSGNNTATRNLMRIVTSLKALAKSLAVRRDPRFSPAITTMSLNWARTESHELRILFDIRTLPDVNTDRVQASLERIFDRKGCRLLRIEIDRPLQGSKDGPFMKSLAAALRSTGRKPVMKTKASSTEAALYGYHGAEAVVFGPGISIGNVHRPNECNSFRQMEIATRFYTSVLKTGGEV